MASASASIASLPGRSSAQGAQPGQRVSSGFRIRSPRSGLKNSGTYSDSESSTIAVSPRASICLNRLRIVVDLSEPGEPTNRKCCDSVEF